MARLDNVRVATNRIQLKYLVIGFSKRKTGFGYGRTWHDRIDTGASDVRAAVETFAWRQLEIKRQQCVSFGNISPCLDTHTVTNNEAKKIITAAQYTGTVHQ